MKELKDAYSLIPNNLLEILASIEQSKKEMDIKFLKQFHLSIPIGISFIILLIMNRSVNERVPSNSIESTHIYSSIINQRIIMYIRLSTGECGI